MAKTIYITGDRSLPPLVSAMAAAQIMKYVVATHGTDVFIVTGDAPSGIEDGINFTLKNAPESVFKQYKRPMTAEGRPDYDAFNESLKTLADEVLIFHMDPLNSSIAKSVMKVFPQDKIKLVLQDGDTADTIPDDIKE